LSSVTAIVARSLPAESGSAFGAWSGRRCRAQCRASLQEIPQIPDETKCLSPLGEKLVTAQAALLDWPNLGVIATPTQFAGGSDGRSVPGGVCAVATGAMNSAAELAAYSTKTMFFMNPPSISGDQGLARHTIVHFAYLRSSSGTSEPTNYVPRSLLYAGTRALSTQAGSNAKMRLEHKMSEFKSEHEREFL
jgi:hypothetical protein